MILTKRTATLPDATNRLLQAAQISRQRSHLIHRRPDTYEASTPRRNSFCPLA